MRGTKAFFLSILMLSVFISVSLSAKVFQVKSANKLSYKVEIPDDLEWKTAETANGLTAKHKSSKTLNGLSLFILKGIKTIDEAGDKDLLNKAIAAIIKVKKTDTLFNGEGDGIKYVNYEGSGALADKTKKPVDFCVYAYQPKEGIVAVLVIWAAKGKLEDFKNGAMNIVGPAK